MALKHPNIVKCLDTFTHNNKLCIVMEWCSEGAGKLAGCVGRCELKAVRRLECVS